MILLARTAVAALALAATTLNAQPADPPSAPAAAPAPRPSIVAQLQREADELRPLARTDAARAFLDAVPKLLEPAPRTIYRSKDRKSALSQAEFDRLPETERKVYEPRVCDPQFYYYTGYGSPLIYLRPLDLAAERAGWESADGFAGKRIIDFGYGLIGHLRLLAMLGADVSGTEVSPQLRALYSDPADTGEIAPASPGGPAGRLRVLHGFWPANAELAATVGDGYDLFISKNVLKRGYIHPDPAREVDSKYLIDLGVDDARFLAELHRILKPGGYVLIYNISPAQNPPDSGKPYLPHADGRCAFTRDQFETAGFDVIEHDRDDTDAALDIWVALGIGKGERSEVAKDLFATYTLARRKPAAPR